MSSHISVGGRADLLAQQGRLREALTLLRDASARNDPDAFLALAMWYLAGQLVPRDLALARSLLRRARELGDTDAAAMEIALTANGSGGPANWSEALNLLRAEALRNPAADAQLKLVQSMNLADDGTSVHSPEREDLVSDGAVARFRRLLTPAECEHVAQAAAGWLQPAVIVDPQTGRQVRHPHRTSDGAVLGPTRETLPIRAINQRIAAASGTVVEQGEALTVLRYVQGQEFRPHLDSLPHTNNQRTMTVLVYLNGGFEGGETCFPAYNLNVRPETGDAIMFNNTLRNGSPDTNARHAGAAVMRGVKWLATRWIRARPFSQWAGPEVV